MYDTLLMLCLSKKCKIPTRWRREIRWAIKHCPHQWEVHVEGKRFPDEQAKLSLEQIDEMIDEECEEEKRSRWGDQMSKAEKIKSTSTKKPSGAVVIDIETLKIRPPDTTAKHRKRPTTVKVKKRHRSKK